MRVAIIGGGPAGLTAAITALSSHIHIDIYEKSSRPGRKILAAGNGRCNLSNTTITPACFLTSSPAWLGALLKRYDYHALRLFFEGLGLRLAQKADGRVYPLSNEAKSVHEVLCRSAIGNGAFLHTGCAVESLVRKKGRFVLTSALGEREYDKVLIAVGSAAAPQLGGGTDGLELAAVFGHATRPFFPVLVGLESLDSRLKRLAGQKIEAGVRLYVENKEAAFVRGDLLFTAYGLSGFAVLDISPDAVSALEAGRKVAVGVDLLPDMERQQIAALLGKWAGRLPDVSVVSLLQGLLPLKIARVLPETAKVDGAQRACEAGAKVWRRLAVAACDWRFEIVKSHGFEHAEAAGGGVALEEVDAKTMMSKKVPGLYFAGEVLDVAGRRGGYNLHFAWASGTCAGEAMKREG